jgi:hypothetical protein
MTKTAWAVQLTNGKYANDGANDVTPALFPTRRAASAWVADQFTAAVNAKVVKVVVCVELD